MNLRHESQAELRAYVAALWAGIFLKLGRRGNIVAVVFVIASAAGLWVHVSRPV
jgi:hypothetical protein